MPANNLPPIDWQAINHAVAGFGRQKTLVQGPGGNVSVKADGTMWVKASGFWLSEAETENIFVPVDYQRLNADLFEKNIELPPQTYVKEGVPLRPSIETYLHAILPQRYVVHCHAVNVLKYATQVDGKKKIADKLTGIPFAWIDYYKPGAALAKAIRKEARDASVIILANHGIITAGETLEDALDTLNAVEAALSSPLRVDVDKIIHGNQLAPSATYRLPKYPEAHLFAFDALAEKIATSGILFPDQAVFLHEQVSIIPDIKALEKTKTLCVIVKNQGVLLRSDASAVADEIMLCLALVAARYEGKEKLNYLSEDEIHALVNWEAEKFRKGIN